MQSSAAPKTRFGARPTVAPASRRRHHHGRHHHDGHEPARRPHRQTELHHHRGHRTSPRRHFCPSADLHSCRSTPRPDRRCASRRGPSVGQRGRCDTRPRGSGLGSLDGAEGQRRRADSFARLAWLGLSGTRREPTVLCRTFSRRRVSLRLASRCASRRFVHRLEASRRGPAGPVPSRASKQTRG